MKKTIAAAGLAMLSAAMLSGCGQLNSALNERTDTHV